MLIKRQKNSALFGAAALEEAVAFPTGMLF
jgi:hypothetical protein